MAAKKEEKRENKNNRDVNKAQTGNLLNFAHYYLLLLFQLVVYAVASGALSINVIPKGVVYYSFINRFYRIECTSNVNT